MYVLQIGNNTIRKRLPVYRLVVVKLLERSSKDDSMAGLRQFGPKWKQFRLAQVLSQLEPRSVELGAGLNREQLVQLA